MPPINRQNTQNHWYDPNKVIDKIQEKETVTCLCGCSYFEQIEVHQFPKLHNVILGQPVQPYGDMGFYVLRCVKCGEIYEPQVQLAARDMARKQYDTFIEEMEKPLPVPVADPRGEVV